MKTQDIVSEIDRLFPAVYKGASKFVNSGAFWDFCIETIKDPVAMSCIVFANDLGIPPLKSLLTIYQRKHPDAPIVLNAYESKSVGALMGFVFKYVLCYKGQKERCTVDEMGVKTATRFLEGPVIAFHA